MSVKLSVAVTRHLTFPTNLGVEFRHNVNIKFTFVLVEYLLDFYRPIVRPSDICSLFIHLVCLSAVIDVAVSLLPDGTASPHRCPNEMSLLNHIEAFIVKSPAEYIRHKANGTPYLH